MALIASCDYTSPSHFDRDEVRRAARALFDPGGRHEIRVLPAERSRIVPGGDPDAVVRAVEAFGREQGIYYTLNPVKGTRGDRAASNNDITWRRNLLVDIDAVKSDPDSPATDAEQEAARLVAAAVLEDLAARGWPAPALIDSGNGWHLVYRIDLPNDALARQYASGVLRSLAATHDTAGARVDTKVFNSARISRLPGTWNRKGEDTADRPHRMCRLLHAPDPMEPVPVELLAELANVALLKVVDEHEHEPRRKGLVASDRTASGLAAYVERAVSAEVARVVMASPGERNNTLNDAAFRLGTLLHFEGADRGAIEAGLLNAARGCGLGEAESQSTIGSGIEAGLLNPRELPREPAARFAPPPKPEVAEGERLTIRASEIVPRRVNWLWPDRLPMGFVTVLAGRTGLGKSFVVCDLAARLSNGHNLPDGPSGLAGECARTLFISEDPYEFVLAPRLIELGADMDMISFLRWEVMAAYTLDDLDFLDRAWREAGEPHLLAIDPPTNFLGAADEHKNAEVRALLTGIVRWLADKDVACVLITHVNKSTGKGVEAVNRVLGSVAWTTTSRIAHSFAPSPDEPGTCLFVPMKSNLGKMPKGLAYTIDPTDTLAVVKWLGEVDTTADEAMAGEKRAAPRRVVASEWLAERFAEKREWPSEDLFRAAKEEGVSRDAIFEAKRILDLPRARRNVNPDGSTTYYWWVPPGWAPPVPAQRNPAQNDGRDDTTVEPEGYY